jgi:hypothetical protein
MSLRVVRGPFRAPSIVAARPAFARSAAIPFELPASATEANLPRASAGDSPAASGAGADTAVAQRNLPTARLDLLVAGRC